MHGSKVGWGWDGVYGQHQENHKLEVSVRIMVSPLGYYKVIPFGKSVTIRESNHDSSVYKEHSTTCIDQEAPFC